MEFFAEAEVETTAEELRRRVRIRDLPRWCASVDTVYWDEGQAGEIYCVWGRFRVHRELLRRGLRFSLPDCPNALQWTLTVLEPGRVQVHCTIDRKAHDPDFVASLEEFVAAWREGLEQRMAKR